MNFDEIPKEMWVTDSNGIPDAIVNPQEILDDGFTLACRLGAARGEQQAINDAIEEVIEKWGDSAKFVFTSSLVQLSRDLVPMVAELAKTATGVDWAKHCEAMLQDNYDPRTVD